MNIKEEIISILEDRKGDDLYRSEVVAARHPELLDKEWGESGKTLRQIIQGYKDRNDGIDLMIHWVRTH